MGSAQRMQAINESYEVLSNPWRKAWCYSDYQQKLAGPAELKKLILQWAFNGEF